jgi:phosphatidylcholine synthase
MSFHKIAAALVHVLTASGVLCTLLALVAITEQALGLAFLWLGLAFFIDAIDGPLARLVDTKKHLPRFSGERLDLIIDYLNYVVLPAFIVVHVPLIDGSLGILAAGLMLMTSLFHFSDTASKTIDGYFIGFPAIWNIVIFYMLTFKSTEMVVFGIVVILSVMTFVPIRWLHPLRVVHLRWLTVLVVLVWAYVAFVTVYSGFSVGIIEKTVLIGAAVYLVVLSLKRTLERAL